MSFIVPGKKTSAGGVSPQTLLRVLIDTPLDPYSRMEGGGANP